MEYSVLLPEFEGPLDLLLHLIKKSDISIFDISIEDITKQYLDYINKMEELNLNIASEYLVMASDLIEMKSRILLPKNEDEPEEEDPREELINRLIDYQQYKESTEKLRQYEALRKEVYTREPSLEEYKSDNVTNNLNISLDDLVNALSKFLQNKELSKPLATKITNKEYSVGKRSTEIRDILRIKKKVNFFELFEIPTKEYVVVTFLAILNMSKKQEITITQDNNFENITIEEVKN
jgi:segregation and condensation protein A